MRIYLYTKYFIVQASEAKVEYADTNMTSIEIVDTLSMSDLIYVLEKKSSNWSTIKSDFKTYCDTNRWLKFFNLDSTLNDSSRYLYEDKILVAYNSSTSSAQKWFETQITRINKRQSSQIINQRSLF